MSGLLSSIYGKLTRPPEEHYIDIFMDKIDHLGMDEDTLFDVLYEYFEYCGVSYSKLYHGHMKEVEWTFIALDLKHYSTPRVEKRAEHFLDFVEHYHLGLRSQT